MLLPMRRYLANLRKWSETAKDEERAPVTHATYNLLCERLSKFETGHFALWLISKSSLDYDIGRNIHQWPWAWAQPFLVQWSSVFDHANASEVEWMRSEVCGISCCCCYWMKVTWPQVNFICVLGKRVNTTTIKTTRSRDSSDLFPTDSSTPKD